MEKIKLVRSSTDKMLFGVLGGIAPLLKIDTTILRLVYALITVFTGVLPGVGIYILCAMIIPLENKNNDITEQEGLNEKNKM